MERVRFSKDGGQLQLTAVDGRRATVTLPNDPELVDLLARNGVDISVSEGEQQGNLTSLLGNLLFPLLAFAGLFLLFRRANDGSGSQGGPGGMGGMGGARLRPCIFTHPLVTRGVVRLPGAGAGGALSQRAATGACVLVRMSCARSGRSGMRCLQRQRARVLSRASAAPRSLRHVTAGC